MTRPSEIGETHRAFIADIKKLVDEHESAIFELIEAYLCSLLEGVHEDLKDINNRLARLEERARPPKAPPQPSAKTG